MNKWMIVGVLCLTSVTTGTAYADIGSIFQSAEGVETDVKGTLPDVNTRVLALLTKEGVVSPRSESLDAGKKQIIKGKKNDIDIQVQLTPTTATETHVIVTARKGTLSWDKDFAQQILSKIIQGS